jgi:hypothetical protein
MHHAQKGVDMSDVTFDTATLGSEASKLLTVLLSHAHSDGRAQVSTAGLLKETGLTQGALVRARSELTRHRLLNVERGYSANGLRGANVYILNRYALGLSLAGSSEDGTGAPSLEGATAPERTTSSDDMAERTSIWSRLFRRNTASR